MLLYLRSKRLSFCISYGNYEYYNIKLAAFKVYYRIDPVNKSLKVGDKCE